jgi:phospholipid/cholesterol/gamma-HCH transport system substrate-binding protein
MKEQRGYWVFLGFAGFLSLAMVVGLGREQHWGQRSQEVQLVAPTAAGLRTGLDVRISGLPVGQVVGLEMEPNASVRVRMKVFESYRRLIGPKSVASQGIDGFVGDHFIAISPDPQPPSVPMQQGAVRLPYTQPVDFTSLLEQLVETQVALQGALRKIGGVAEKDLPVALSDIRRTMAGVNKLSTTLNREVDGLGPQLKSTLKTMDRTGDTATELMKTTGPVLAPTLKDVQGLAASTNRLLYQLFGSGWLNQVPAP